MRSVRNIIRYRRNVPIREMLRGLRVISNRTGMFTYTGESVFTHGGWVDRDVGPRFDPKANRVES